MIKRFLYIITVLFLAQELKAQDETSSENVSTFDEVLSFHPFHLINNGIRIDYDRKLWDNHWIQIGPQFYASERENENEFREYTELLGVGVTVNHRIYLGERKPSLGTYFSYGFTYNHYNLKYDEENQANLQAETNIDKFGADIIIGYQSMAFDKLIIDIYAGLGTRYSNRTYTGITQKKFNEFLYDYGYTGNVLVAGIRIGFGF